MLLPEPLHNLIESFSRLPGIGPKTASRLAFFLLRAPEELSMDLAQALQAIKTETTYCQTCFNITVAGRTECEICTSPDRNQGLICVVEEPLDVMALERTEGFGGRYHVLHGVLSRQPPRDSRRIQFHFPATALEYPTVPPRRRAQYAYSLRQ